MNESYYFIKNGQITGPFNQEQVDSLLVNGGLIGCVDAISTDKINWHNPIDCFEMDGKTGREMLHEIESEESPFEKSVTKFNLFLFIFIVVLFGIVVVFLN